VCAVAVHLLLQDYINRQVGEKLPHHLLPLHCCAIENFNQSRSSLHFAFKQALHHLRSASSGKKLKTEMARVRSTVRVSREGDETEVTETAPILEVMRRSGMVV
jgi:hypothetical protein